MMTNNRDYTDRLVLGAPSLLWWTLLLALALRLVGIWHGLPYAYQIDEKYVVNHAVGFGTGDLNPHNFHWPGTSIMYLLFVEYGILFVLGWIIRVFPSPEAFAELFVINPTVFYLVGRVTIALLGTMSVFLGYVIGKRFYCVKVGCVTALFVAVSSLMVGVDHMVLPDTLLVFLGLLTLLLSQHVMQKGGMKHYLLAGLCIGLAVATKYSGAALVVPLGVAHLMQCKRDSHLSQVLDLRIMAAASMILFGFVIGCPFSILDFPTFIHDLSWQFRRVHSGSFGMDVDSAWHYYFTEAFPYSIGYALTVLSVFAFLFSVFRHTREDILIGSFVFCYALYVGSWKVAIHKYMLPVLPLMLLFSARLIVEISSRIRHPKRAALFVVVLSLVFAAEPFTRSVRGNHLLCQKDTRTVAKEWIENTIPYNTKIAIDAGNFDLAKFSPPLNDSEESLRKKRERLLTEMPETWAAARDKIVKYLDIQLKYAHGGGYQLTHIVHNSDTDIDTNVSVEKFREDGVRYVIVSSYASQVYLDPVFRANSRKKAEYYSAYYASLERECHLIQTFHPVSATEGPGPIIKIYEVPASSESQMDTLEGRDEA